MCSPSSSPVTARTGHAIDAIPELLREVERDEAAHRVTHDREARPALLIGERDHVGGRLLDGVLAGLIARAPVAAKIAERPRVTLSVEIGARAVPRRRV